MCFRTFSHSVCLSLTKKIIPANLLWLIGQELLHLSVCSMDESYSFRQVFPKWRSKTGNQGVFTVRGRSVVWKVLDEKGRGSGLSLRQAKCLSSQLKALDSLSTVGMKNVHNTLFRLSWKEKRIAKHDGLYPHYLHLNELTSSSVGFFSF